MNALQWLLIFALFSIYLVCVVTVCMVTFRKGYIVLGIVGIAFPLLWVIGVILPAKKGSAQAVQEALQREHQAEHVAD